MKQFFRDIKSQKLRAILTLSGIVWGTVILVTLLAFGEGFTRQMMQNMDAIGENPVFIWSGATSEPFLGYGVGRRISLEIEDIFLLKQQITEINLISPHYSGNAEFKYGKNTYFGEVEGVYPSFGTLRKIVTEKGGRFINAFDMAQKKRVIIIGDAIKNTLFKDEEPLGKYITLNDMPFVVIGYLPPKTQLASFYNFDSGFIPASLFSSRSLIFGTTHMDSIAYNLKDPLLSESVQTKVKQVLGKKHRFSASDKNALGIWDTTEVNRFFIYFLIALKVFLGIIGSFTLIVGGIGVASIMNVVVEERVKEIGLKIALGAKRSFIMTQFITETIGITLMGGIIGIIIAYGIISIFPLFGWKEYVGNPVISLPIGIIVMIILGIIGFIAGLSPARRAVHLNPVEALRL
ncbi:MAG: ABC transporter permease [Planctomycetota bacterium]